ncbi:Phosphate propanoyltransferase [Acholeplasma oculi]|uniref:Phosphate propanoyltransferase n=1 Tax=Acholeplasma oculi TaxID=35623 RepID=A0A061AKF2_9MOLU|nr:phosphate propanoyltransferase [Acholeplasma oculi]CDR31512.1 similar to propanediol utilisation protein PduL [Acholeplasma oculi]SKC49504.1 putative phosphotransacetylase [Acholeplasma oculi]SUT92312.1 Phosphate propanoyltransferase [Acholeplasma oculi]
MKQIPVGISGRHVHVTKEHLEILFGEGHELKVFKMLSQPGQYAAEEKVDLVSPEGKVLEGVRILGPTRKESQVEISQSDAIRYKFVAPVRSSGDVAGSGACKLVGPKGEVSLPYGVIIADRHIHFSLEEAAAFGVSDREMVSIKINGTKPGILDNVLCRVHASFRLDCHLDTDDGAAFMLKNGDLVELVKKYVIVE